MKPTVIFIVGPTGVGKTSLSLLIAEKLNAEIVSADSRQIYKYMDIGTAKPSQKELARVPHHFINILDPQEDYNAGRYSKDARLKISEIFNRGRLPLVVGGSGLYIKALIDGIFDSPIIKSEIRDEILKDLRQLGIKNLYDRLKKIDPQYAQKISENDPQRITRALEVSLSSGIPFSQWHQTGREQADFDSKMYGLNMKREWLYDKINQRVDNMFEEGLLDEVSSLLKKGYSSDINSLNTVGYKEVFRYLKGEYRYDEMVDHIKRNTRHYAKRQLTWFKKDEHIQWFDILTAEDLNPIAAEIVNTLR